MVIPNANQANLDQAIQVEWLPWGPASEREQWALDHPMLAGIYFGLMFGLLMALPIALLESLLLALVAVPVGAVPTGIMFARRMTEEAAARGRPDYQAPSRSGVFSQFSDGALTAAMLVGGFGVFSSIGQVVFGSERLWWSAATGCVSAAMALGAAVERRRR